MGTSGDKIVLLDGMGSGSGSAANGLLSMIPGMFTSLLGGNKMDPNLVAALMNGRNNQDQFGGANGWWLWIIVLFWLWGGRGFGNGFGNGQEEYDDEIYDRRGGRGRSRRSDGTYMGYDGGVYDHYGKDRDGMMEELERRERNLERRERELERNERELEKRQKHHEREDEMYRKGWFGEREIRDEYDSMDPYMRRGRRSRYY